jgi:putative SOS response-associated peptidase YedK
MCGRYVLKTSTPELARILGANDATVGFEARYNIAPTTNVPIVVSRDTGRHLISARWGLVPFWSKDSKSSYSMLNARAETIATKPSFRQAYQRRRCIIPADGYYEWQRRADAKQPYFICGIDEAPLSFAGLWERWQSPEAAEPLISCTIVTTSASADVDEIHDRMPVLLGDNEYAPWLTGDKAEADALLQSTPTGRLQCIPISTYVNNARNNGPRCVMPLIV